MARIHNNRVPYDSHPLYNLRRNTLIAAALGAFLDIIIILGLSGSYGGLDRLPFFVISTVLLGGSIAIDSYDLVTYGTRAAIISAQTNANDTGLTSLTHSKPTWPSKTLLVWDLIFAIILQWMFWCAFFDIIRGGYYRYGSSETLEAYANLANFVTSLLHAFAFWKELLARKKSQWQRDLDKKPCESCGYIGSTYGEPSINEADISGIDDHAGPSSQPIRANFGRVRDMVLPRWARAASTRHHNNANDGDIENEAVDGGAGKSLLVTPEESTKDAVQTLGTYGSITQSSGSLNSVPETIVRKKDKGKKKLVDME